MEFTVRPYTAADEAAWDRFVMTESANGTFLQTRRFLNYHPAGRFEDASLLVLNEKGVIAAVVPAAVQLREGKRVFRSHPGSTYGGIVLRGTYTAAAKAIGVLQAVEDYLRPQYDTAELRPTPALFAARECEALTYAFYYLGWEQFTELSTWVPTAGQTPETLLASFRNDKRQSIKKAMRHTLDFRPLETREEVAVYHALLAQNLAKYNAVPVHTAAELWEFKTARLPDETALYGVYEGDTMVAGGMTFAFRQANVLHAQYLSADLTIHDYSPASFVYYKVLCLAAAHGYKALSWGISTEDRGKVLNFGLIESKEGYNSRHALNLSFTKSFGKTKREQP